MTTTAVTTGRMPGLTGLILSQIRYQLQLFLSTPSALVIGVGLPVALLVATGGEHPGRSALSILAGYAVFGLTMTAFNTHGVRLIIARESGVLRRWRASPLPPWCYFVSQIVTTSIFATFTGAATFVVGMLFFGAHVTAAGALAALAALLLGALAWSALSTALTGLIPSIQTAQPAFILIYFPVVIISGALGTVGSLPHWLTTIARYLPAEPLISAVSHAVQHGQGATPLPGWDLLVLAVWAVAGLAAAIALFRWEPHRRTQRRAARPAS